MNQADAQIGAIIINDLAHEVVVEQVHEGGSNGCELGVTIGSQRHNIHGSLHGNTLTAFIDGHKLSVLVMPNDGFQTLYMDTGSVDFSFAVPDLGETSDEQANGGYTAPMNGTIVSVLVKAGANVSAGEPLIIMEAMKMQHTISAPSGGVINELFCASGELVDGGSTLLSFDATEDAAA